MFLPRNHNLQISTCFNGSGGASRAAVPFDIELIKSPANSGASSPSSTLSENSSGELRLSIAATRKPRTPRKRPNQTYNEAAALLSTAYPNLFPSHAPHAPHAPPFLFDDASFVPEKAVIPRRERVQVVSVANGCESPSPKWNESEDFDFDAESILDEEIDDRGIDSIMGDAAVADDGVGGESIATAVGIPIGLGLGLGFGIGIGIRALRSDFAAESELWWRIPAVDMVEVSPATVPIQIPAPITTPSETMMLKKKKKPSATKKMRKTKSVADLGSELATKELSLNLDYDAVLKAWSGKGSPFSDENDLVATRLGEIELFPESEREACVLRYKEKRRTRLFSKKIIRYQVRKVNADQRPRMKGRFVRRPNSKHEMNNC